MGRYLVILGLMVAALVGYMAAVVVAGVIPSTGARALGTPHRIAIQVSSDDPAVMSQALNNVNAVLDHYAGREEAVPAEKVTLSPGVTVSRDDADLDHSDAHGEAVQVEIVTFGPGLTMLRDDTSPVKERLRALHQSHPDIQLSACSATRQSVAEREGKEIPLVPEATVVPSGAARLAELQEQGWSYLRP